MLLAFNVLTLMILSPISRTKETCLTESQRRDVRHIAQHTLQLQNNMESQQRWNNNIYSSQRIRGTDVPTKHPIVASDDSSTQSRGLENAPCFKPVLSLNTRG